MPIELSEEQVHCVFIEANSFGRHMMIGRVWLQVPQRQARQDRVGFAVSSSAPISMYVAMRHIQILPRLHTPFVVISYIY